jgi:hypothetical protein
MNARKRRSISRHASRSMPRTTTSFHSVRGLHRWSSRQGSENLAAEAICPTRWEMGEALLPSVWLCQRSREHCHRPSRSHLPTRLSNPNRPDEPLFTVEGHSRPQHMPPLRPAHVASSKSSLSLRTVGFKQIILIATYSTCTNSVSLGHSSAIGNR